uniref:Uncharacterized protein n=1 Tax=Cacopsylla melanoneura TaxID=428564 RepID=A0A8D9BV42_9HEMI
MLEELCCYRVIIFTSRCFPIRNIKEHCVHEHKRILFLTFNHPFYPFRLVLENISNLIQQTLWPVTLNKNIPIHVPGGVDKQFSQGEAVHTEQGFCHPNNSSYPGQEPCI